jgi:plasmid stabilization system protein ParE
MRVVVAPRARRDLGNQLGYLADQGAPQAAARLERRLTSFIRQTLTRHPRIGRHVDHRELWEIWVPRTRIVLWYRFTGYELEVVRVWHTAQNRSR